MNFKKSISALVLGSILMTALPIKKAEAGIVIGLGSLVGFGINKNLNKNENAKMALGVSFFAGVMTGFVVVAAGVVTGNPVLVILSEDGNLSQDQLEGAFTQRYSFIYDREVIRDLASIVKSTADSQKPDAEGKILVSIPKGKVRAILQPLDLSGEDFDKVVNDLK